jgi:MOSC domain-containing protein YiiM
VTEQDQRCLMITLDPETGEATPAVLKAAGQLNGAYAGVYASVLSAGRVTVGDSLVIESA